MTNKILPPRCVHLERDELKHAHTLELATSPNVDSDYRYGTGPDTMQLCAFCTGRLHAALLMSPAAGIPSELDVALLLAARSWLTALEQDARLRRNVLYSRGVETVVLRAALERWLEQKSALDPNKRLV